MKTKSFFLLALVLAGYACNNSDKSAETQAQDDVNAARSFIRSALDGKFDEAKKYMLADSANIQYLAVAERNQQRAAPEITRGYRESSINIYSIKKVNDSSTIVIYSNSFKNNPDTLKVLRQNDKWLVDLKYLYEHDMDTTLNKPRQDTLR
jgi:type IV secretory pathway component VirB8